MRRKTPSASAVRLPSTARWIGSSHVSSSAPLLISAAAASPTNSAREHGQQHGRPDSTLAGVSGG